MSWLRSSELVWNVQAIHLRQSSADSQIDRSTYTWFGSNLSCFGGTNSCSSATDAAAAAAAVAAHLAASRGSYFHKSMRPRQAWLSVTLNWRSWPFTRYLCDITTFRDDPKEKTLKSPFWKIPGSFFYSQNTRWFITITFIYRIFWGDFNLDFFFMSYWLFIYLGK